MARLIVLDASVAIAALAAEDPHHEAATAALATTDDDDIVIAATTAALKGRHRALSLPDAIALVVAELVDADEVWTLDRRWRAVDRRVTTP